MAASESNHLLVIGGRQREARSLLDHDPGWYGYRSGRIIRIGPAESTTVLDYQSRPGACLPDDPVLFKSATRRGDRLYCCTQTEVIVYELPSMRELVYVSLPRFNDVHHVTPTDAGTMLVANSGMETVVEIDEAGNVVGEWNVLGEDTWAVRDPSIDYRLGVDLKPHRAHPNHVFVLGGEPFATRFELRDAVSLRHPHRRIVLGGERVHDGVLHGDHVYFTSVDGQIVEVDRESLEVTARHRLATSADGDKALGWCRGLAFEGDEHCWVGFSRIRPTKLRQTVSWVRTGGAPLRPTRIAKYRLPGWEHVEEINVEPLGLDAVFSIIFCADDADEQRSGGPQPEDRSHCQ